ncbi:hypothetical protein D1007_53519 [Hordeum vulgare]|nr:hypothetical protein D1007_53519 [Hordeum vulgare]
MTNNQSMASQTPPASRADVHGSTAINDDVIYEILLSLPAKPLCRLRAVCRSWQSLLSAPSFIAAHKARQAAPLLVVRDREDDGSPLNVHILDILSGESVRQIRVKNNLWPLIDSSMVLMRPPHDLPLVHLPGIDDGVRLRVLDPAAATAFALPRVDHDKQQQSYRESFMIGRAPTGAYKVLCISTPMMTFLFPNDHQLCRVLTLSGDRRWRETGCPPVDIETFDGRDGAAVMGVAYFLLLNNKCMVAYDLEKEVWRTGTASLPAPVPGRERVIYHSLAELGGCLALLYEDWDAFVELWLLVDSDKVIWSKLCTITVPYRYKGVHDSSEGVYLSEPLWLLDDGRIIFWVTIVGLGPQLNKVLCAYDPRTMTYTDVADMSKYTLGGVFTGSMLGPERVHLLEQGGSL